VVGHGLPGSLGDADVVRADGLHIPRLAGFGAEAYGIGRLPCMGEKRGLASWTGILPPFSLSERDGSAATDHSARSAAGAVDVSLMWPKQSAAPSG
jgi:hypothetical protein